jgi:hypothetical protein
MGPEWDEFPLEELLLAIQRADPCPGVRGDMRAGRGLSLSIEAVAVADLPDAVVLRALADYGRGYEFIIEVEVPFL